MAESQERDLGIDDQHRGAEHVDADLEDRIRDEEQAKAVVLRLPFDLGGGKFGMWWLMNDTDHANSS